MQSLDEIINNITSKTERLIRKLNELSIENQKLQKENKELKQNILASNKVNLFSQGSIEEKVALSKTQDEQVEIRQELESCISDVKSCLALIEGAGEA